MDAHNEAVAAIAHKVQEFYKQGKPFRVFHGSTNSTRRPQYQRNAIVDISKLSNVIRIDAEALTALVEPNVDMEKLVDATLKHNLVPQVVMEFPGITTGGGYAGHSGESSSFRHGLFSQTIQSIEFVQADGTLVTSSRTSNPDLLQHAAESYGTLGILTLLEVKLMPANDYVELTYHPVSSTQEAVRVMQDFAKEDKIAYIDAIMFERNAGVVMTGLRKDARDLGEGLSIQTFTKSSDPWFYLHARSLFKKKARDKPFVVVMPLRDYLFRYDRNAFWMGPYAFRYFFVPCNRVTRRLLNRFMHTRGMFHALHESTLADQYICQDIGIPLSNTPEFVSKLDTLANIYPLWFCPVKVDKGSALLPCKVAETETESVMMVNIGIWGYGSTVADEFLEKNRKLEDLTWKLGGQKALYARTYYTEDKFWQMYDRPRYEELRQRYNAQTLLSVYDKVRHRESGPRKWWQRRPLDGFVAVAKYAAKSDYLFKSDKVKN